MRRERRSHVEVQVLPHRQVPPDAASLQQQAGVDGAGRHDDALVRSHEQRAMTVDLAAHPLGFDAVHHDSLRTAIGDDADLAVGGLPIEVLLRVGQDLVEHRELCPELAADVAIAATAAFVNVDVGLDDLVVDAESVRALEELFAPRLTRAGCSFI